MTGKTHEKIGFITPILLTTIYCVKQKTGVDFLDIILLTAFSTFGSTLPDIDQTQSKSGKKMPITSHIIKLVNKISKKLKLKRTFKATGHRGLTHSFLFWFFFFTVFTILNQNIHFIEPIVWSVYGLFLGIATHLILDMFNPTGIPLFAPVSYINFHLAKIKTDSSAEKTFKNILIFFMVGFILINISKLMTTGIFNIQSIFPNATNISLWAEDITNKIRLFLK